MKRINDERILKSPKKLKKGTHPLGVKPSGNAILEVDDPVVHRIQRLGLLGYLPDDLLMVVIQDLDEKSLFNLGSTCKSLFAYCWFDELWKQVVYKQDQSDVEWKGSWRRTALKMPVGVEAQISADGVVYSDFLHRPYEMTQLNYTEIIGTVAPNIEYLAEDDVTVQRFDQDLHKRPFITRLKSPIAEWTLDDLLEKFGNEIFRQEYMDWPLRVYKDYCAENQDETPLYLFDCKSKAHKDLKFQLPLDHIWGKDRDLFTLFGGERPDHQWLIIGPKRSGSTFHKDPNATSAWNSVISGRKYWIMFPANDPPPGVWTDQEQSEVTAPTSLGEWFASGLYKAAQRCKGFHHAITGPGEVMYVPSGWWHAVVNLDDCIALTGNFVVEPMLPKVLRFLKDKSDQISGFEVCDKVYEKFLGLIEEHHPEMRPKLELNHKRKWAEIADTSKPFTFSFA